MRAHHRGVWDFLRRRGFQVAEVEDLVQDTFMTFYEHVLEGGFPAEIGGFLRAIVHGKLLNHVRGQRRSPCSVCLPSSGSEPPRTGPDLERAIAYIRAHPQIHDVLISLDDQLHVLAPLPRHDGLFLHLVLARARSNLALARHRVQRLVLEFELAPDP